MCVHKSPFGMTQQGCAHAFTWLQTLMPSEYSSVVTPVLPTHALRHARTHTHTHIHTHTHRAHHTHTHTHQHTHINTHQHTHIHQHTHTCAHMPAHTHTHTHRAHWSSKPEAPRRNPGLAAAQSDIASASVRPLSSPLVF